MKVNINVQDINDNKPELAVDEIYVCENDNAQTVRRRFWPDLSVLRVVLWCVFTVELMLVDPCSGVKV